MPERKPNWYEKKLKEAEEREAMLRKHIKHLEAHIVRQDKIIFECRSSAW